MVGVIIGGEGVEEDGEEGEEGERRVRTDQVGVVKTWWKDGGGEVVGGEEEEEEGVWDVLRRLGVDGMPIFGFIARGESRSARLVRTRVGGIVV